MNLRLIIVGIALIVIGAAFFFYMSTLAPQSNDPAEMMRTVGMVAGGGAGLGLAMILIGFFRKKRT